MTTDHCNTDLIQSSLRFFSSDLFHTVQMSGMFSDSKHFADATPKFEWQEIYQQYASLSNQPEFDLASFVDKFFSLPASVELLHQDATSGVAAHIEALWDVLTKQPDEPQDNSLLALQHPYLVPGGRFREIYYWDSYFSAIGLIQSGRHQLVKSMLRNFIQLQQQIGCIPNGNRSYYFSRSQPPVLGLMVELLLESQVLSTEDDLFNRCLNAMEQEYQYWMRGSESLSAELKSSGRVVRMPCGAKLNRFWDEQSSPRPESYREDIEAAEGLSYDAKQAFYRNIRAACESGWDFSSRWLATPSDLNTIQTTSIIPVDLNSLMFKLETLLSQFYAAKQDQHKAHYYAQQSQLRQQAINRYLWHDTEQFYLDYNWEQCAHSAVKSLAATVPLFVGAASEMQAQQVAKLLDSSFLAVGGLKTTLCYSQQQWDAPNGWAPLQWFAVKGLVCYGQTSLAKRVAKAWLNAVESYFDRHGCLMEKYNVECLEHAAKGGEYEVQHGFGWTNGVTLGFYQFLMKHRVSLTRG